MHEAEVEGTRSQSPMCLPVAMGNPLSTHTEASTKLITAHQAHHCDDHARSQNRDKVSLPKHRDSIIYGHRTDYPQLYDCKWYEMRRRPSPQVVVSALAWPLAVPIQGGVAVSGLSDSSAGAHSAVHSTCAESPRKARRLSRPSSALKPSSCARGTLMPTAGTHCAAGFDPSGEHCWPRPSSPG